MHKEEQHEVRALRKYVAGQVAHVLTSNEILVVFVKEDITAMQVW